jgi:hypothetical protein
MYIEAITLRSTPHAVDKAQAEIRAYLTEVTGSDSVTNIELFHRYPDTGDLLILLHWDHSGEPVHSRLGLMMTRFLEKFGSVYHTIWISEQKASSLRIGNDFSVTQTGDVE